MPWTAALNAGLGDEITFEKAHYALSKVIYYNENLNEQNTVSVGLEWGFKNV